MSSRHFVWKAVFPVGMIFSLVYGSFGFALTQATLDGLEEMFERNIVGQQCVSINDLLGRPQVSTLDSLKEYRQISEELITMSEAAFVDLNDPNRARLFGEAVQKRWDDCEDLFQKNLARNEEEFKQEMRSICHSFDRQNSKLKNQIEILQNRAGFGNQFSSLASDAFEKKLEELKSLLGKEPNNGRLLQGFTALTNLLRLKTSGNKQILNPKDLEDLKVLKAFLSERSASTLFFSEWADFVSYELTFAQDTLKNKNDLLLELLQKFKTSKIAEKKFRKWDKESKIAFLVKAHQILFNPFEYMIDIPKFISDLKSTIPKEEGRYLDILQEIYNSKPDFNYDGSGAGSVFKSFLSRYHPIEKTVEDLADTPQLKKAIVEQKFEGLKNIRDFHLKKFQLGSSEDRKPLIVGSGPSGLSRAISFSLYGRPFRLIEKRESGAKGRKNIITVGQGGPEEMNILFHLGIVSAFRSEQDKASFSHLKPHLMEVEISNLELELKKVLTFLNNQIDPVEYDRTVKAVRIGSDGSTEIQIGSQHGEIQAIHPHLVFVNDGSSSQTRKLFGIRQVALSEPTLFAISFLDGNFNEHHYELLQQWLKSPFEGLGKLKEGYKTLFGAAKDSMFLGGDLKENYLNRAEGPAAVFRVGKEDYVFHDILKEEQKLINNKREEILRLRREIQLFKGKLNQKIPEIEKEISIKEEELDQYLEKRSLETHARTELIFRWLRRQHHHFRSVVHRQTTPVDSVITRAESSNIKLGNAFVMFRGDASHTTDATSGYGAKTAIEEILADMSLILRNDCTIPDIAFSANYASHLTYGERMNNRGFYDRAMYRKATDTLERYLYYLKKNEFVSENEATLIKILALISQKSREAKDARVYLEEIYSHLITALKQKVYSSAEQEKVEKCKFKDSQRHQLQEVRNSLLSFQTNRRRFDPKEIQLAQEMSSRLAYNGYIEGSILGTLVEIVKIFEK